MILNKTNDWSSIILSALGSEETTRTIRVKTLKSHYHELLVEAVFDQCDYLLKAQAPNYETMDHKIAEAIALYEKTHDVYVRPFVDIPLDDKLPIVICVDVNEITDDCWKDVVELISENSYNIGVTEFGPTKSFNPNHLRPTFNIIEKRQTFI